MTLSRRLRGFVAAVSLAACATQAQAQPGPAINTGGPTGAYHTVFCPPLPGALAAAYFHGYGCTPSAGTVENIERGLAAPSQIGLAQLDIFARMRAGAQGARLAALTVARQLPACEGLWMVTNNQALTDFGKVLELLRRIRFVLPAAQSGSAATFAFLRSLDPEGLGQIPEASIGNEASVGAMLSRIAASTTGEVGFFVQFADPSNDNIRFIVEHNLAVIPVVSRPILRAQIDGQPVYQVRSFSLTTGGAFGIGGRARRVDAACTPVALITGDPERMPPGAARTDQEELVRRLRSLPDGAFLPQAGQWASLITGATRLSQAAVGNLEAAADAGMARLRAGTGR